MGRRHPSEPLIPAARLIIHVQSSGTMIWRSGFLLLLFSTSEAPDQERSYSPVFIECNRELL